MGPRRLRRDRGRPGSGPKKTRDIAGSVPVLHVRGSPPAARRRTCGGVLPGPPATQSVSAASSACSIGLGVHATRSRESACGIRSGPWPRAARWVTNCAGVARRRLQRSPPGRAQPPPPRRSSARVALAQQADRCSSRRLKSRPRQQGVRARPRLDGPRRPALGRPPRGLRPRDASARRPASPLLRHAAAWRAALASISRGHLGMLLQEGRGRFPCPGRCARRCRCTRSRTSR